MSRAALLAAPFPVPDPLAGVLDDCALLHRAWRNAESGILYWRRPDGGLRRVDVRARAGYVLVHDVTLTPDGWRFWLRWVFRTQTTAREVANRARLARPWQLPLALGA